MSVTDRFRLDGRTAILTGVGPGVGEHVAKAYAELGANFVISARSGDRLERIAADITAADGGRSLAVTSDACETADLVNLVSQAREAFCPIHIIFHNASACLFYANHCKGISNNAAALLQTSLHFTLMSP